MARPPKSLVEHVVEGTFRSRRHHARLLEPDVPWPGFAALQHRYRAATSVAERRAVGLEFEHAVAQTQAQARNEVREIGGSLRAELELLGPAGSVEQLLGFFPAFLSHTKGPMIGEPFRLEEWQTRFLSEFYARDSEGRRVYRHGVLSVPRGCGKTPLAAGLALYELVSRHDGPEVYFAAGSKEQAKVALGFARGFVDAGPLNEWVRAGATLSCSETQGVMKVLSSQGALQHGLAPAVAILDELWAFTTASQREAYDALASALHKRVDPWMLVTSTAGYDRKSLFGQICEHALKYPEVERHDDGCLTIARDLEHGNLYWGYGAPADAEINDKKVWRAANPASWIDLRQLERQQNDPGLDELSFRRLHLNQWVKARQAWLPEGCWAGLGDPALKIPTGAPVYVGVDVGLFQDTTAVAWAYPHADGRIIVRCRVWAARDDAAAHVHVAGKVQLEEIERFIIDRLATRFRVEEVAYDPRFFDRSAEILEQARLSTVEFLQASAPMYDATQRFYQLAVTGKLKHNNDKTLAAHLDAVAAHPGEHGWRISKRKSSLVIDAAVAAVMAVARADLANAPKPKPDIHWFDPNEPA